jgi:hypothetical protein
VEARGAAMNGEIHAGLDTTDFLLIFPLKGEGRARLVGTIREEAAGQPESLSWNDVNSGRRVKRENCRCTLSPGIRRWVEPG